MSASLKSTQVSPLPIGSGGSDSTKREMNDVNVRLAMLASQGEADQKFDPPVPKPVGQQIIKEAFCSDSLDLPFLLSLTGVVCIVYGILSK